MNGPIGVVGCGTMGSQLSLSLLSRNVEVIVKINSLQQVKSCVESIEHYRRSRLWKRYIGDDFYNGKELWVRFTEKTEDLSECSFIFETVHENYEAKFGVFEELGTINNPDLIVASNTSTLLLSKIAEHYPFPDQVCGMHFFNPIALTRLVEVTLSDPAKDILTRKILSIVNFLDKQHIIIPEKPGLFVNRMFVPFLLEAIRELGTHGASAGKIDFAIKMALNHPVGPLEIIDIVGLDVFMDTCNNIFMETNDNRYMVPDILIEKVNKKELGKKTGTGFYNWKENKKSL